MTLREYLQDERKFIWYNDEIYETLDFVFQYNNFWTNPKEYILFQAIVKNKWKHNSEENDFVKGDKIITNTNEINELYLENLGE